ncbi:MAG: hypothetical protein E2O40_04885 [Planctomycetota bacterium]|nr:MAG: hypothetical protein E2O40_04885 [Planctomycetota bacterium]
MAHRASINLRLTGLSAVLMAAGPVVAESPEHRSELPDGRISELVSIDEAAARALAFIDAVAADGSGEPDPTDTSTRGWHFNGKDWYWYGMAALSETQDVYFGFYDDSTQALDQAAYDAPSFPAITSTGSDRGQTHDGGHFVRSGGLWVWSTEPRNADGGSLGYDSIGQLGCAKNVLTIGEANDKGDNSGKRGLSGWGPTDDGRIKPDIVANGKALFAPAGSASDGEDGVLVQHYRATHGGKDMLSATLKALVIHTAGEAGAFDGPDYRSGWGQLSVSAAVRHIKLDTTDADAIQQLQLSDGGVIEQVWNADGKTAIKATICWTDPAGTPSELSLNPSTPMLVNDLDLRIIGPGNTVYEPWVLDPADPDAPASRGDNDRDNVEVVMIDAPAAGVYRLQITHKGTLVSLGQNVALMLTRVEVQHVETPPFIVWRNTVTIQHVMWFMDGPTLLPETGLMPGVPSADWNIVGAGDFDGDGSSDLLWRNLATGDNLIWFMTGTSLIPDGHLTVHISTDWSVVATEDFDGDGKTDILWRNSSTGGNALWFMDGTTLRPETAVLPAVVEPWQIVGCGDFDGDGFRDLLWRHAPTGQNVIWFLAGTAMTIDVMLPPAMSTAWQAAGAEDFDGDGKADILWRNTLDDRNELWFMDGATLRPESGQLPAVPAVWNIAAVSDLDRDGSPEILWRNMDTGQNYIWFLQGTSLVPDGVSTTSPGLDWEIVAVND